MLRRSRSSWRTPNASSSANSSFCLSGLTWSTRVPQFVVTIFSFSGSDFEQARHKSAAFLLEVPQHADLLLEPLLCQVAPEGLVHPPVEADSHQRAGQCLSSHALENRFSRFREGSALVSAATLPIVPLSIWLIVEILKKR